MFEKEEPNRIAENDREIIILFADIEDPIELPTHKTEVWKEILTRSHAGKRNYPPLAERYSLISR